jgi:hypothetical protein
MMLSASSSVLVEKAKVTSAATISKMEIARSACGREVGRPWDPRSPIGGASTCSKTRSVMVTCPAVHG